MSEEISLDMSLTEESYEELKKALGISELEEAHNRFMNGTETENDLINNYHWFKICSEDNEFEVVMKKYYAKLVDLYNNLKEIEEEHRKLNGELRVELDKEKEKINNALEYMDRYEVNSIGTPFSYTEIGKELYKILKGE